MKNTLKLIITITALISAVSSAVLLMSYFDSISETLSNTVRKISAKTVKK